MLESYSTKSGYVHDRARTGSSKLPRNVISKKYYLVESSVQLNVGHKNMFLTFEASKKLWVKKVDILTLNGKNVLSSKVTYENSLQAYMFDLTSLPLGFYQVKVTFNTNTIQTHKVLIMR